MESDKYGTKWSAEETILAFYYYCKIPFGRIHKGNPEIIRIASILGRTPSSVSRKMGNLGHFDPELRRRTVSGLSNASKIDAEVVAQFYNNWEELSYRAQQIELAFSSDAAVRDVMLPSGSDREQTVKARVNHQFFHDAVLSSYRQQCCITGIDIPTLLIASHIKPWAVSDPRTERTNPCNGLCLNALHDRAFDKGLITVLPDYSVRVSSQISEEHSGEGIMWLKLCDHQKITLPEKFAPNKEFLEYHNDVVFIP